MSLASWLLIAAAAAIAFAGVAFCVFTSTERPDDDSRPPRRWQDTRQVVTGLAGLALALALLGGGAYGTYVTADATNALDGLGLDGAWSCDEFENHKEANAKLRHELRHRDQGSIKALDPDGNGKACDGWNHTDADGYLSKTPSPVAAGGGGDDEDCHSSYEGACLDPSAYDYDCEGGKGDGPEYTGPVEVVGPDDYDLDRNGDGYACDW